MLCVTLCKQNYPLKIGRIEARRISYLVHCNIVGFVFEILAIITKKKLVTARRSSISLDVSALFYYFTGKLRRTFLCRINDVYFWRYNLKDYRVHSRNRIRFFMERNYISFSFSFPSKFIFIFLFYQFWDSSRGFIYLLSKYYFPRGV